MTNCSDCSTNLVSGALFCPECGKEVSPKSTCHSCGAESPAQARFCVKCGSQRNPLPGLNPAESDSPGTVSAPIPPRSASSPTYDYLRSDFEPNTSNSSANLAVWVLVLINGLLWLMYLPLGGLVVVTVLPPLTVFVFFKKRSKSVGERLKFAVPIAAVSLLALLGIRYGSSVIYLMNFILFAVPLVTIALFLKARSTNTLDSVIPIALAGSMVTHQLTSQPYVYEGEVITLVIALSIAAMACGTAFLLPDDRPEGVDRMPSGRAAAFAYLSLWMPGLMWLAAPVYLLKNHRYKNDPFIRFHAFQAMVIGAGLTVFTVLFRIFFDVPSRFLYGVFDSGDLFTVVYTLVPLVYAASMGLGFAFLASKAVTMKPVRIPVVFDMAMKLSSSWIAR